MRVASCENKASTAGWCNPSPRPDGFLMATLCFPGSSTSHYKGTSSALWWLISFLPSADGQVLIWLSWHSRDPQSENSHVLLWPILAQSQRLSQLYVQTFLLPHWEAMVHWVNSSFYRIKVGRCCRKPLSIYINMLACPAMHLHSSMIGSWRK